MQHIKNGTDSNQGDRGSRRKREGESKSPGKSIRQSKKMRGVPEPRSTGLEIIVMIIKRILREAAVMEEMRKEEIEER